MPCDKDYIDYVCEQISDCGRVHAKPMFGEFMIYVNDKPILLVCNNTAYVKILPCIASLMDGAEIAIPYDGAKERYILNIDNRELCQQVVNTLEPITKLPVKRAKKK